MSRHNKSGKSLILFGIFSLLVAVILISGCSTNPNANSGKKTYYKGYDSIDMKFSQESPPVTYYYDSECETLAGNCVNEIPIVVEIKNKGSSDSFGALYVHGYDPHIMSVAGEPYPGYNGYLPGANNINFGMTNVGGRSAFSFSLGGSNVYVGLRGGSAGGRNVAGLNLGFQAPNGMFYGTSAWTEDRKLRGLSVNIFNPLRIGHNLNLRTMDRFKNGMGIDNSPLFFRYNTLFLLEGDTPESPGGGTEVYEFPAMIYTLPESLESFRQPIMVTACYDYVTRASGMVCIDPNPNSNNRKICKPSTISLSGGQGAPVSVTRIEQQSSTRKTVFTIYIKHTKKDRFDRLFDYYSLHKCNPYSGETLKATDENIVYIGDIKLSGNAYLLDRDIYCTPNNRVRLDESGNGQISCSVVLNTGVESAYEAPLEIDLWYGYSKSIEKIVNIRRI